MLGLLSFYQPFSMSLQATETRSDATPASLLQCRVPFMAEPLKMLKDRTALLKNHSRCVFRDSWE
jgi:hypothetical protein